VFEELYKKYFHDIFLYSKSLCREDNLAEELTQETFFKAMQKLDDFRGDCSLTTWLCRIARNLYLNHKSRQKRGQDYLKQHTTETVSPENVERELIQKEQARAIVAAVQKLDDPYKEVFSLRVFSELSFKEIGNMFGKNDSWARVTYHRAKLKIKEELKDEY
jgi:RNA polymerase sigma-70 factor (ECF subfamily)